jgi:RND family efflux transporter MFP subunit
MNIEEGDNIRRGQKIATLDMESLRNQIAEIQTSLDLAQEVYSRQERLWKQDIGSEIQFLQAKNNKERLEKSIESIQYNLTKGDVFAPASGVVEKVMLKSGEMAGPGSPILQILNVNKVKVSIDVPEKYLKKIRKGSRFKVELPTLEYEKTVKVTDIGRMIDPGNRTFKVEANISSNGGKIKPNLMAIAYISDYELKDALALDSELIQQDITGSSFVFVVEKNGDGSYVAVKKYIEIGESIDNQLIVTSGLVGDEELIVDGARIINEGQEIIIENASN